MSEAAVRGGISYEVVPGGKIVNTGSSWCIQSGIPDYPSMAADLVERAAARQPVGSGR